MKLKREFYTRQDTVAIARELLGKVLVTHIKGQRTAGIIVETEAYHGVDDKACHAYGGRRTARTEAMYARGGQAYVYLCYGIHHLFNVVTYEQDHPHAVLIRGIVPLEGVDTMLLRRSKKSADKKLAGGPGTCSQALGITTAYNTTDLLGSTIWIEDRSVSVPSAEVLITPRIGVDYAGPDALLPYRFVWNK